MPDTKTSRQHDHNQGNQNRSYTAEQKAAVDRVRKCKGTDYYAILDVKKEVTADGIKQAYRRLALVMHPDKNGAPGADEAFKLVSKAFQVLSDPQQRETFDQFGGDPAARGGGGGGEENPFSGSRSTGGRGAGGFARRSELSPEDLFNMFFGEGFPGPGPFGGEFVGGGGLFGGGFGGRFGVGFGGRGPFGEFVSCGGGLFGGRFGGGGPFGEFVSFGGGSFGSGFGPFDEFVSSGEPGVRVQHSGGPGMVRRRPTEEAGRADQSQHRRGRRPGRTV
ncbi:DnaJ-domain-containing protein [Terfezia boudieri ATCC MYA-4762]|uniref:DnaJ-domain-containing protein n=1 Tax=Terfezia boudieri ATCC MYA-4762 TaxID=1051890 RepID=A0A3N4LZW0_9PEZI|nr:DnaJ-domain-containing protein [Terfezia boudieri ATCC MYA-4762]